MKDGTTYHYHIFFKTRYCGFLNLCADIIFMRPLVERKSIIWSDCVCSSLLPKFLCFEVPIWINDRKKNTVNCALVDVAWRNSRTVTRDHTHRNRFLFPFKLKGIWLYWQFPSDYGPNGFPFGSKTETEIYFSDWITRACAFELRGFLRMWFEGFLKKMLFELKIYKAPKWSL